MTENEAKLIKACEDLISSSVYMRLEYSDMNEAVRKAKALIRHIKRKEK